MVIESPEKFNKSVLEAGFIHSPSIDWLLLGKASEYYRSLGYIYKETPWAVPEEYSKVTKPHNNESFQINKDIFSQQSHELVGSAEQGFLYLIMNNMLPTGKYYSVSPCFRVDSYDNTHLPWFMKLELFAIGNEDKDYQKMTQDAYNFFSQFEKPEIIILSDGTTDININNLEVGSYGIRSIEGHKYAYGTGLALPRFSISQYAR